MAAGLEILAAIRRAQIELHGCKVCDALAGCVLSPPSVAVVWCFGGSVVSGFQASSCFAEMLMIDTVAGGAR